MATCDKCGKDIDFVTVDGTVRPFHYCQPRDLAIFRRFDRLTDFSNPNARCPSCQKPVFYYQNSFGSRVFFDAPGIPWAKHRCTDIGGEVEPIPRALSQVNLKDNKGRELDFFKTLMVEGFYKDEGYRRTFFRISISTEHGFKNDFLCLGGQAGVNWNSLSLSGGFFRRVSDRERKSFMMHFLNRENDYFASARFSRNPEIIKLLEGAKSN
jgi:hypothetical protein